MVYKIFLAPEHLSDLFYICKAFGKNLRSENDHLIQDIALKKLFPIRCV